MEKLIDHGQPRSALTVPVTPAQLRLIADRMESEARTQPQTGKEIYYSMTRNIELIFDPRSDVRSNGESEART